jgi:hypothetical protein
VRADRELPVVWAVAKGSLVNKVILVPVALAVSALAPWAVTPLLMVGGLFLCYEGFEKLAHRFLADRSDDLDHRAELAQALVDPHADLAALERDKIKGAVRTDFVLSAEIVAITLGTVAQAPFATQLSVLAGIALVMTVGVYGFVAAIVKLDDGGLALSRQTGNGAWPRVQRGLGRAILTLAPWLMKALSIAGTAAMFLVGGGILTHGLPPLHHAIGHALGDRAAMLQAVGPMLADAIVGVVAGAAVLAVVSLVRRLWRGHPSVA